jgi:hypothetical protein
MDAEPAHGSPTRRTKLLAGRAKTESPLTDSNGSQTYAKTLPYGRVFRPEGSINGSIPTASWLWSKPT